MVGAHQRFRFDHGSRRFRDSFKILRDGHVYIRKPNGEFIGYQSPITVNFHPTKLLFDRYLIDMDSSYENLNNAGVVAHARVEGNFAHIVVLTLGSTFTENVSEDDLDALIAHYPDANGIILDLRVNSGGNENNALHLVSHLTTESRVYSYVRHRIPGEDRNAFTEFLSKVISVSQGTHFEGPVVALTGEATVSSAEAFALMIRALPNGILMGDVTRGSSGNPVIRELPDLGIQYSISTWMAFDADRQPLEDFGLYPDIWIAPENSYDEERDYVLERAIEWLKTGSGNTVGIPDRWAAQHQLILTAQSDADRDGFLDRDEYLAGTDPKDPLSQLHLTSIQPHPSGEGLEIRWQGVEGKRYRLRRSSNPTLSPLLETVVQDTIEGKAPETTFTDRGISATDLGSWFYQVEVVVDE
ncbi:MAG TPA: hypothetical protein EYQ50_22100 [Verrucomicrobiales bacterium]|nr:hypothetical protein [Verrucomicrobiales bacterium]